MAVVRLRSSPTLEGRCCSRPGPRGPGGRPRGCDPHRPWRAGAAQPTPEQLTDPFSVAILTDPGGPVLPVGRVQAAYAREVALRSSPTLEGRCCERTAGSLDGGLDEVAILTDPGGPVLLTDAGPSLLEVTTVAILTDPGGPVLPGHPGGLHPPAAPGCDPHRPWRAGAALVAQRGETVRGQPVAILTDPGGPVLPTW